MREACQRAVESALGRPLNQAEARLIEERVANQMRVLARQDPVKWRSMPQADRLTEAGKGAARELAAEARKRKERIGLAVIRQQANDDYVNEQIASGEDANGIDAIQRLLAPKNDFGNNGLSVETISNGMFKDGISQLIEVFEAIEPGLWRFIPWEDRRIQDQMRRALAGETKGVEPSFVQAAKIFHDYAEALRVRFNEAGGVVGKLDNWDQPHAWSARLAVRNKADFVNDFVQWADRTKYVHEDGRLFSDDELRAFFEEARLTIATDGLSKPREVHPGGAVKANRHRAHRQIHLQPKFVPDALRKYSERNVMESMVGHVRQMTRDVALVEAFGPNPDLQFEALVNKFLTEAVRADDAKAQALRGKARYLARLYDYVAGNNPPPESRTLSEAMSAFRSWQIASKLGSAAITSITDSATIALTNHVNNLNHAQVFLNTLNAWTPQGRRYAQRMALLTDTLIGEADRFAVENLTTRDVGTKVASFVMRASGLNFLTEARRVGFALTMMDAIGHLTRRYTDVTKLKEEDGRALASAGITQEIWDVWRAARVETRGANHALLSPDAIRELDINPALRQRAIDTLVGIVAQETDVAVIQPGARERVQMSFGQETNSINGEIARTVFLFKAFPWSLIQRHWERGGLIDTISGLRDGEGLGAFRHTRYGYMVALFGMTSMAGALSLWINDILRGKDPRNMLDPRNALAALLKGGGMGILGDFLFSETSQYGGNTFAETLLGPAGSVGSQALGLTFGNAVQAAAGEETDIGGEAIDFVQSNTPGMSLWYAKGLFERYWWDHLRDLANPGYNDRRMARQRANQGTEYWWPAAEPAPERAPDLEAAIGRTN